MKRTIIISLCLLVGVAAGCSNMGGGSGGSSKRLNGGGSSFVYPLMSKWAAEYNKSKGIQVNYQSIGSGGGIQQMTAKTLDFGCTDAPMNDEQLAAAREKGGEVVHIPLVMGAVAPAYNLEEAKGTLTFSGPVLADIFLGKITKWNDPKLKELNPSADLPSKDIAVVHRSDGSGTTYIWADYLSKVSDEWKNKVGVSTSLNFPTGVGQKGSEGVAGQVKRTAGSITYVELTYALENGIKVGMVKNKDGVPVEPSLKSVTAAAANALSSIPDTLRYSLTDAPGKESYPICGTTWAVLYVKQASDKGADVVNYLRWCTHEGQQYSEGLHYAQLPKGLVERLDKKLDQVQAGK